MSMMEYSNIFVPLSLLFMSFFLKSFHFECLKNHTTKKNLEYTSCCINFPLKAVLNGNTATYGNKLTIAVASIDIWISQQSHFSYFQRWKDFLLLEKVSIIIKESHKSNYIYILFYYVYHWKGFTDWSHESFGFFLRRLLLRQTPLGLRRLRNAYASKYIEGISRHM